MEKKKNRLLFLIKIQEKSVSCVDALSILTS